MSVNRSCAAMVFFPLLVLLLALAFASWTRRRALTAPAEARAAVWFGCVRFLRNLNLGTVALWWFVTDLVHLKAYAAFWWESYGLNALPTSGALFLVLFWIPPMVVLIFCQVLFQPVYAQVRGIEWSRTELARIAAYSLGVWLIPALFLVGAFQGIDRGDNFPAFAVCALLAVAILVFSSRGLRKQFSLTPYALSTGELRDRAFSLAAKLGVKLRQIYLLPPGKSRLANAFARSGNSILLTEVLLNQLNKREVDAVIAHELSHLKHDHPRLLGFALLGGLAAIAVPYYTMSWPAVVRPYFDLLFVSLPLLAFYLVARRFEYTADATAGKLTGDPAASISGLVKLHHLNLMPLEWSKWSEKGLTHPSTTRRARAIGRAAAMSEERVAELLATPAQGATADESSDHYLCPVDSQAAGKIFSTQFKQRIAVRTFLSYLVLSVALPALFLRVIDALGWPGSGTLAFALCAVVCCGAALVLSNFLPFASNARLCRTLRAKFLAQQIPDSSSAGVLVGFSPGASPRIFESNYTWDVGSLIFSANRLCYFGEETQFALRRDQIISVQLGAGFPGWFRSKFLYVTSQNADGVSFTFNLRPLETNSARQLKRSVADLENRVQNWRGAGNFAPLSAEFESLGAPRIGAVTSTSSADARKPGQAFTLVVVVAAISGCISSFFGLPVEWISPAYVDAGSGPTYAGLSGWYAIAVSILTVLVLYGPFWLSCSANKPTFQPTPPPPVPAAQP